MRRVWLIVAGIASTFLLALVLTAWATWPNVRRLAGERPTSTAFIDQARAQFEKTGKPERLAWSWVPDDSISPNLKRAVLASEDIGFFAHHGFEVAEMRDALAKAWHERAAPRGASTITQQLAKNLWLSPSRNPIRKLKEALLTRQLERWLTKRRILELYLNVVQFGPGIYGAEAAAQHYFGKPAADLTEHESAMLAAALSRPEIWNPQRSTPGYERQFARIEERMARATFLAAHFGPSPPVASDSGLAAFLKGDTLPADSLPSDTVPSDTIPSDTFPQMDSLSDSVVRDSARAGKS
jgi:monofunctional biosynthetic peptidoglycan transglycosylase